MSLSLHSSKYIHLSYINQYLGLSSLTLWSRSTSLRRASCFTRCMMAERYKAPADELAFLGHLVFGESIPAVGAIIE